MDNNKQIVQVFNGYIESIDKTTNISTVHLIDITEPSNSDELAEIDFNQVNKNIDTVEEGYMFSWYIGNILDDEGNIKNIFNEFIFNLSKWTEDELAQIRSEANELHKKITWE